MRWFPMIVLCVLACCRTCAQNVPGGTIVSDNWGTLWTCGSTYKVMPDTAPPTFGVFSVDIAAARNEFEPFQLVLRPKTGISGVKVTTRFFTGPKGARIPAFNVSVRNVEYVNLTGETADDMPKGLYPDPLPQHTPFDAPRDRNTAVWITVYVPPKTPAGDYTSVVEIEGKGLAKIKVPVKLHVWGFDLPTVSRLRTAYGCNMDRICQYQGAKTLDQQRKILDAYNTSFWRHRVAPYKPYWSYKIKSTETQSGPKLDFTDFDVALEKYFPLFNSFQLPSFARALKSGERDPEDDQKKIEYMRAVTEHLAAKGQIHKGYNYIFDEPEPEQYKAIVDAATVCRMTDDRIKVLLTEQVEDKLIGSVDIWVPLLSMYDEEKSKARQAKGEEVWWYVCCTPRHPYPNYFIEYPAVDQRILPWITWRYGVDGILFWEVAHWIKNPWEDPKGHIPNNSKSTGNGEGILLYPPTRKPSDKFVAYGPVPSIRWELIREGMEDYDYFAILSDLTDKLRKSKPDSPAIEKASEALLAVHACATSRTEYAKDPVQLEAARRKVAEAIVTLGSAK